MLLKCYPISYLCAFEECPDCPEDDESLREVTSLAFAIEGFEDIEYQQWVKRGNGKNRVQLVQLSTPREEFVDFLTQDLIDLVTHHFIAMKQSQYFKDTKESLEDGEVAVMMDFSEN